MSTSKSVIALTAILVASFAGLAVADPPAPADAGRQGGASREGGARVKPVNLPTGQQQPGNQPAPQQSTPSPATSTIPTGPRHQDSQRNSARGAASSSATRRDDARLGTEAENKLDQQDLQDLMSKQVQAEGVRDNVAKRTQDPVPKETEEAIFGPAKSRDPTRNASGASRKSTVGASDVVPPQDPR